MEGIFVINFGRNRSVFGLGPRVILEIERKLVYFSEVSGLACSSSYGRDVFYVCYSSVSRNILHSYKTYGLLLRVNGLTVDKLNGNGITVFTAKLSSNDIILVHVAAEDHLYVSVI